VDYITKREYYKSLLEQFLLKYQTADLSYAVRNIILDLFENIVHILNSKNDIDNLFENMGNIISAIPYEREKTPLGCEHIYDDSKITKLASELKSMNEFIAAATADIFKEHSQKKYFVKFIDDNSYNGPAEYFLAAVEFKDQAAMENIFKKLRVDFNKKEVFFNCLINEIPVFISLDINENKSGKINISIVNAEDPYKINEQSVMNMEKLEIFLKSIL